MEISAADLFCGGGGSSEGLAQACEEIGAGVRLVAVNHNPVAVASHRANHPDAVHFCQDIRTVKPREAVPSGHLDILLAGMPCPHFSVARGGRPMDRRERSTPKEVLKWVEALDGGVDDLALENVQEFVSWGPIRNGRPIPEKMGQTYRWFIRRLERLGYNVEARVLNAADYGAATTRRRLFIQARRGMDPAWPEPTHTEENWRAAREIIDWSIEGTSIFKRKELGLPPLAQNTIRRIAAGIEKYCGEWRDAFLCMLYGTGTVRSIDRPLPTVTSGGGRGGGHIALCQFVLQQQSGGAPRDVSRPIPTIAAKGAQALINACLVPFYGERKGQAPRTHSLESPLPVIPATGNGKFAKVDFIVKAASGNGHGHGKNGAFHPVENFIVKYFGTGVPHSVDEPAPTVTTKDRIGLVQCGGTLYGLDIRFRMLQPHELAAAMSFPKDYHFEGNRGDKIRQIGNAWDVNLGKALCLSLLSTRRGHAA